MTVKIKGMTNENGNDNKNSAATIKSAGMAFHLLTLSPTVSFLRKAGAIKSVGYDDYFVPN